MLSSLGEPLKRSVGRLEITKMIEDELTHESVGSWFQRLRWLASWIALIAFVSFVIPHVMIERFEPNAFKWAIGAPRPPNWQFIWRNVSLLILVLTAMVSIPKWGSLIPFVLAIGLIAYASYGI